MSNQQFNQFWAQGKDTSVPDAHGGYYREFKLKMQGKEFLTHEEVVDRAQKIRSFVLHNSGGKVDRLQVAVKDRKIGQWRSGKFTNPSDPEIYVWSPDDYDSGEDDAGAEGNELEAVDVRIYLRLLPDSV